MYEEHSNELNRLGAELYNKGNFKGAFKYFEDAIFLYPKNAQAYNNLGLCYVRQGEHKRAMSYFKKALKYSPDYEDAHINLANAYLLENNLPMALHHYGFVEDKLDEYPKNYLNLGLIYIKLGNEEKAESYYQRYNKIDEDNYEANNNLGVILSRLGRQNEALRAYQKAIRKEPKSPDAYFNIAIAYSRLDDYEKAVLWLKKGYKVDPQYPMDLAHLVNRLPYICEWKDRKKLGKELDKITSKQIKNGEKPGEQPFMNIIRVMDPKRNLEVARAYSRAVAVEVAAIKKQLSFIHSFSKNKKIRLGYVSNGFRNFPTAHNITRVLEIHDRKKFEVFLYSFGKDDKSVYRKRAENLADKFTDITKLGFIDSAKKIYADKVDILIDLKGYTGDNRIEIMALKPAPIVVSLLGFVGTTGSDFHDYLVVDRTVVPKTHEKFYTEKLVFMPDTYWPTDNTTPITNIPLTKKALGLPRDSFVFGCFNNPYKIEPEIFDVWMNILKKVPNGVLWIIKQNNTQIRNLKKEAGARGVNPKRLIFAGNVIKPHHLARLKLTDLALDTRTVNGHTTTTDALWAGVAVITIIGKHFASRVSASMLKAVGLPELVTQNLKEYEKLAVSLAKNKNKLLTLRTKLSTNIKSYPLFNTEKYTKDLEKLYLKMYSDLKHVPFNL